MASRCVAVVLATVAVGLRPRRVPARDVTRGRDRRRRPLHRPVRQPRAGAVMGNALEDYCEGQPFRFRITG